MCGEEALRPPPSINKLASLRSSNLDFPYKYILAFDGIAYGTHRVFSSTWQCSQHHPGYRWLHPTAPASLNMSCTTQNYSVLHKPPVGLSSLPHPWHTCQLVTRRWIRRRRCARGIHARPTAYGPPPGTGSRAPAPTSKPPGARGERLLYTSPHPTGSHAPTPTATHLGDRPKRRVRTSIRSTGTRAPEPTSEPPGARP
jgi:hypothetical protein